MTGYITSKIECYKRARGYNELYEYIKIKTLSTLLIVLMYIGCSYIINFYVNIIWHTYFLWFHTMTIYHERNTKVVRPFPRNLYINFGMMHDKSYDILIKSKILKDVKVLTLSGFIQDHDLQLIADNINPDIEQIDIDNLMGDYQINFIYKLLLKSSKFKELTLRTKNQKEFDKIIAYSSRSFSLYKLTVYYDHNMKIYYNENLNEEEPADYNTEKLRTTTIPENILKFTKLRSLSLL